MESFADFENATVLNPKAPVDEEGKPLERWAPLGANDSPDLSWEDNLSASDSVSTNKLQSIVEEHELLNSSLLSLTSHFAQVQFRLEQVLQADPEQKEALLRDLEQFAWKGVPDLHLLRLNNSVCQSQNVDKESQEECQKRHMAIIIEQLKAQLHDLEQFAYRSGEIQQPPTLNVLEKQRLVLEELGNKLGLNVSEIPSMTEEEIKEKVNAGVTQLTNPIKTKEALVNQLKTQITDLERFIEFLHDEGAPDSAIGKALEAFRRYQQERRSRTASTTQQLEGDELGIDEGGFHIGVRRNKTVILAGELSQFFYFYSFSSQKTVGLITRALTLLQVFVTTQLASRRAEAQVRAMKYAHTAAARKNESHVDTEKSRHWGDVRARLEIVIDAVLEKAQRFHLVRQQQHHSPQSSTAVPSSEDSDSFITDLHDVDSAKAERELYLVVSKQLCPALGALIEHGSRLPATRDVHVGEGATSGLAAILSFLGCFSRNRLHGPGYHDNLVDDDEEGEDDDRYYIESEEETEARILRKKHAQCSAWTIFLKYYIMTNGRAFNDTPARKLSQSFSLDIIGGTIITTKQHLLSSIGTVLQEFNKYKRSEDAQFKALVCIGLK
ncbi:unnamed protein product [Mesocestoides corti]|uniref:RUN domain-containing protein n=1 Tax=Mesocestoides corti TaxID=53468 RepID=A0A158QUY0_MESCO|nr:unnamed protein product [Mesocestoides corti]